MRTTVVERFAVWSPSRKHFKFGGVILKVSNFSLVNVLGDEVTPHVIHFNLVVVHGMEPLSGLICGIDN